MGINQHLLAELMINLCDFNLKISLILAILIFLTIFMGNLNFMLSRVEHVKSFIILGSDIDTIFTHICKNFSPSSAGSKQQEISYWQNNGH